jgi:hypothetical protein
MQGLLLSNSSANARERSDMQQQQQQLTSDSWVSIRHYLATSY